MPARLLHWRLIFLGRRGVTHEEFIVSWLHTTVEASANVAFALSGLLAGVRKRLDMVGLCVVRAWALLSGYSLPAGPSTSVDD